MAPTRVISVIGRKNSGKTTLVVALVREFARRGHRVGTIKHGHHPALVDQEGKDTWRHFHEAQAERTMIESPGNRVLFERAAETADPVSLVREYMKELDVVVLEGFKRSALPKIEVHRTAVHAEPLFDPAQPDAGDWVAMVTDDRSQHLPFPCFVFTDTSWFTSLAHLAWEHARQIE